jgi:hypothetical protein
LKSVKFFLVIIAVSVIAGCAPDGGSGGGGESRTLLTVDFQKGQTLKYLFTSKRTLNVDWGQGQKMTRGGGRTNQFIDTMRLIVSYTPTDVDPYGVTTIKALCEQAWAHHDESIRNQSQPDAVQSLTGKTWTFTVDATGKIVDDNGLRDVIREAGKKAFRADTSRGLIKEPDMMYDFIASQWFLWDSISSIKKPVEGVSVGDMWKSRLSVPSPMFLFTGRDVNYTLAEIRQEPNNGKIAVINSSYSPFYPTPPEWPLPYTDRFMMSGTFGFLRNYKVLDLKGSGQEFFNIDKGQIQRSEQQWEMNVSASLPLEIGPKPTINIKQSLTMELVEPASSKTNPAPAKTQGH